MKISHAGSSRKEFSVTSILRDSLILIIILGSFFALMLGKRALCNPDEGRYAEIAREMNASGDYITPRLNGVKYFEKPPLMYWLTAGSLRAFGHTEWAARLWPAVFALGGCLLAYIAGTVLYSRKTGIFSALILGTCTLYYAFSHILCLDMALTFFMNLTLVSMALVGFGDLSASARRRWHLIAFVGAAGATLSKGLIGFLLPGAIVFIWAATARDPRWLRLLFDPLGLVIFFALVAPWHWLVMQKNPEFGHFYFIHEHFERYLSTVHRRDQSNLFFIPILFAGFFPWISFLLSAKINIIRQWFSQKKINNSESFLLVWAVIIFVFFSFSHSKLIPYILPIFPALSLLTGRYLVDNFENKFNLKAHNYIFAFISMLIVVGFLIKLEIDKSLNLPIIYNYVALFGLILAVGIGVVFYLIKQQKTFAAIIVWGLSGSLSLLTIDFASPIIMERKRSSVKKLVEQIRPLIRPEDIVFTYNNYYQDLPFYLNRTVGIVNWQGELSFGQQSEPVEWLMSDQEFWQKYGDTSNFSSSQDVPLSTSESSPRIFVFMSKRESKSPQIAEKLYQISDKSMKEVVMGNRAAFEQLKSHSE